MKDKKIFNVLTLLKELKNSNMICTADFAEKLNVSVRTVQRYLEDVSVFFDAEPVEIKRGCYKFPDFAKIKESIIDPKDYRDFEKTASLLNAMDKNLFKYFKIDEKLLKKIVKNDLINIKHSPIEEIINFKLFQNVKKAVKYSQTLNIEYEAENKVFFKNAKPYKKVFTEGNWYLVIDSGDEINGGIKFLRLNFIKDIT